jgi:tripartite-type tricarboxylate transporter receptor subunit TctC
VLPPGTPKEAIDVLRKAFDETVHDPEFLADAERMRISIAPLNGAEVQDLIGRLYATPKAFVDRAKAVIKP